MKVVRYLPMLLVVFARAAAPTAMEDVAFASVGDQVVIDVLANDSDTDPGTTLVLEPTVSGAVHGSAAVVDGKVVYQAGQTLANTDELTYTVSDGVESTTGTITIGSIQALKGTYAGLAQVTSPGGGEPGNIQLQLNARGSATVTVVWQGISYKRQIAFIPATGGSELTISKGVGVPPIELSFQLQPQHNRPAVDHLLSGRLTDAGVIAEFLLGHVPAVGDEGSVRPEAGRYTSILQCDALSEFADPGGFAHFTIPKARRSARILLQMPDAEFASVGSPYAGRRFVINRRLYKGTRRVPGPGGHVASEPLYTPGPALARAAGDFISDQMSWRRNMSSTSYYPGGIDALQKLLLKAGGYTPVLRGAPPPVGFDNFTSPSNGELVMEDGDLPATIVKSVRVPRFGTRIAILENDLGMRLSISGRTGVFSGSFIHPGTSARVKFTGVFDETLGEGVAAFRGSTVRGLVTVRPVH